MLKKNRKLRNYIIFPRFQFTLVLLNFFILFINFILLIMLFNDGSLAIRNIITSSKLGVNSNALNVWNQYENLMFNQFIFSIVLIFLSTFILTIIVTHRVLGPIYNLRSFFSRMAETGKIEKLSFRANDYYEDLPPIINSAIEKISSDSKKQYENLKND